MATAWFYSLDGNEFGPVQAGELKRLAETGEITPDDLVRKDGMENWVPAKQVRGLFPKAGTAFECPKCNQRLTVSASKPGDQIDCPNCKVAVVPGTAPVAKAEPKPNPPPEPMPLPPLDQGLVLSLYDLLRDEPVFVDWYLKTCYSADGRWARCELPKSAFWSRWGVAIAISWLLAFTGFGLAVTVPFNIYAFWKFHGDQTRYKEWRRRVDAHVHQIGLGDALALMERAPKVRGFKQFFQYASSLVALKLPAGGDTSEEQEDA